MYKSQKYIKISEGVSVEWFNKCSTLTLLTPDPGAARQNVEKHPSTGCLHALRIPTDATLQQHGIPRNFVKFRGAEFRIITRKVGQFQIGYEIHGIKKKTGILRRRNFVNILIRSQELHPSILWKSFKIFLNCREKAESLRSVVWTFEHSVRPRCPSRDHNPGPR
jgi:hypothetical protein